MNWRRGLKRLRIVLSVLGLLAGLIIFGIGSFLFHPIPETADRLGRIEIEIHRVEELLRQQAVAEPQGTGEIQVNHLTDQESTIEDSVTSTKRPITPEQARQELIKRGVIADVNAPSTKRPIRLSDIPDQNQPITEDILVEALRARFDERLKSQLKSQGEKQLEDLKNSANSIRAELHRAWKLWFVTTAIGGFFSFLIIWLICRVIAWVVLGFIEA